MERIEQVVDDVREALELLDSFYADHDIDDNEKLKALFWASHGTLEELLFLLKKFEDKADDNGGLTE